MGRLSCIIQEPLTESSPYKREVGVQRREDTLQLLLKMEEASRMWEAMSHY